MSGTKDTGEENYKNVLESAIKKAKSFGADCVDLMFAKSGVISVTTRLTKLEKVIQADIEKVDLRVSIGNKHTSVSCDNLNKIKEDDFIEKAVSAARNSPEETGKIRADSEDLCKNFKEMDICDRSFEANPGYFIEKTKKCEEVALQIKGISNSEGSEAGYSKTSFTLMRDDGFCGTYEKTSTQFSVVTLAERNGKMERDWARSAAVYEEDLRSAEDVAKEAAEKTLKRLGARKVQSCKVPVVFSREVARQILGSMLEVLNGASVARGMSFLKGALGNKVFSDSISVVDQYDVCRGLRSRPFDADGLECHNTDVVRNGVVKSFLLNTKYADKLEMKSTANASGWDGISPNNVRIENGEKSFEELLTSIKSGFYVTDVMGVGVNAVTGNYSQGVAGFWIENGALTYPVNEITVAGNFLEMFSHCNVASDLKVEYGLDSPSIFFEEMVVGGI